MVYARVFFTQVLLILIYRVNLFNPFKTRFCVCVTAQMIVYRSSDISLLAEQCPILCAYRIVLQTNSPQRVFYLIFSNLPSRCIFLINLWLPSCSQYFGSISLFFSPFRFSHFFRALTRVVSQFLISLTTLSCFTWNSFPPSLGDDLGPVGAKALADILETNKTIRHIYISSTYLNWIVVPQWIFDHAFKNCILLDRYI